MWRPTWPSAPRPERGSRRCGSPSPPIAHEHASRGAPSPATHPGVRRVLRGLARSHASAGRTSRQAAALTGEVLAAVRATAHRPRTGPGGRPESAEYARRRGDMDIATASVMRDALLRRSEAAALTWADVARRPDGTGRLTVRRSKGDQAGEGAELYIGREAMAALERVRPESAALANPLFGGLGGRAIADRIRRAARAAGREGDFSGHSPRIGMARDLAACEAAPPSRGVSLTTLPSGEGGLPEAVQSIPSARAASARSAGYPSWSARCRRPA